MPGGVSDAQSVAEPRLGVGVAPLVELDLADVVRGGRNVDDVADPLAQAAAALVEVSCLVPAALVVRLDPEVVEDAGLADEIADLLEDRQREPPERMAFGISAQRVDDMAEVVRVREVAEVVQVGGALDHLAREAESLRVPALPEPRL